MIIVSTSLTVAGQPSLRFHVAFWLPFKNRETDYSIPCDIRRSRNLRNFRISVNIANMNIYMYVSLFVIFTSVSALSPSICSVDN